MLKHLLAAAGLVLASLPALAQPLDCSVGGDWNGRVDVDAQFSVTGRTVDILASVCRRTEDTADSARVWGVMRYLRDVNGTEHHYAHPECIRVFTAEQVVVLAGRTRGGGLSNWLVLHIDMAGLRIRALNMTQADALASCQSAQAPTLFPASYVSGSMVLE